MKKISTLCCGIQEKTQSIVFQFLDLFLTALLDYASRKTPLPPLILFLCLLNFFFLIATHKDETIQYFPVTKTIIH